MIKKTKKDLLEMNEKQNSSNVDWLFKETECNSCIFECLSVSLLLLDFIPRFMDMFCANQQIKLIV